MTRLRRLLPALVVVTVAVALAVVLLGHVHHKPKPFLPYPVFTQSACNQAVAQGRFQWFDYLSGGGWEPIMCGLPG